MPGALSECVAGRLDRGEGASSQRDVAPSFKADAEEERTKRQKKADGMAKDLRRSSVCRLITSVQVLMADLKHSVMKFNPSPLNLSYGRNKGGNDHFPDLLFKKLLLLCLLSYNVSGSTINQELLLKRTRPI